MANPANEMPSRSGVRLAGDRYQWLHVWRLCQVMIREGSSSATPNPIAAIELEINGAGNLDDAVLRRRQPPHEFAQIKYAVDASTPINLAYMSDGKLLARLVASHSKLSGAEGLPTARLITNREVDPTDLVATSKDGRDGRLVPRAASGRPNSPLGTAFNEWTKVSEVSRETFLAFLECFHLETSYSVPRLEQETSLLMEINGLRHDAHALDWGVQWVANQVIAGHRSLEIEMLTQEIEAIREAPTESWGHISVSMIDHDPRAKDADVVIDWVDQVAGSTSWNRVAPMGDGGWTRLAMELDALPGGIGDAKHVLVTGPIRQATAFKIGSIFRHVLGYHVAVGQGNDLWRSDGVLATRYGLDLRKETPNLGDDVVLVVAISTDDVVSAVQEFVANEAIRVRSVIVVRPPGGATGISAIGSPEEARSFVRQVRDIARQNANRAGVMHLFLAGPLGFSLLLGNGWNRTMSTRVYEFIAGTEYVAAYDIDA